MVAVPQAGLGCSEAELMASANSLFMSCVGVPPPLLYRKKTSQSPILGKVM